jgi:hypothetical protein
MVALIVGTPARVPYEFCVMLAMNADSLACDAGFHGTPGAIQARSASKGMRTTARRVPTMKASGHRSSSADRST